MIGMLSYSIYMVHPLVEWIIGRIDQVLSQLMNLHARIDVLSTSSGKPISLYFFGSQWTMDGFAIFYLVCTIALSALTYKFIEKPGRRFFNAWAQPK